MLGWLIDQESTGLTHRVRSPRSVAGVLGSFTRSFSAQDYIVTSRFLDRKPGETSPIPFVRGSPKPSIRPSVRPSVLCDLRCTVNLRVKRFSAGRNAWQKYLQNSCKFPKWFLGGPKEEDTSCRQELAHGCAAGLRFGLRGLAAETKGDSTAVNPDGPLKLLDEASGSWKSVRPFLTWLIWFCTEILLIAL